MYLVLFECGKIYFMGVILCLVCIDLCRKDEIGRI